MLRFRVPTLPGAMVFCVLSSTSYSVRGDRAGTLGRHSEFEGIARGFVLRRNPGLANLDFVDQNGMASHLTFGEKILASVLRWIVVQNSGSLSARRRSLPG